MDLDTTRLVPKGLIRPSPRVQRDGCAGNRPFRRQKGREVHQVNDGVGRRPFVFHAARRVDVPYRTVFLILSRKCEVFRRPYVRKTGGKPLRIRAGL
jgi:hypothetical protein